MEVDMVTVEEARNLLRDEFRLTYSPRIRRKGKLYVYAVKTLREPRRVVSRYVTNGEELQSMTADELRARIRNLKPFTE
jgi:hypothetical protein